MGPPWRGFGNGVLCFLAVLGGWVVTPAEAYPAATRDQIIYVIAGGWHTEIALPNAAISGHLAALAGGLPGARFLVFGWGAQGFYMAPNPGFGELLRAALPRPAVLLVTPLAIAPAAYFSAANVWPITVTSSGAADLAQFLWTSVAKDRNGAPNRIGPGPYPQSTFYAATGTYDASNTCNTWTAEALRAAGLPVTTAGIVSASQLLTQLPPLGAAAASGDKR